VPFEATENFHAVAERTMPIPISQKLMFAARKAYQVSQTGPVPDFLAGTAEAVDDAKVGWLPAPQNGFASGNDLINAGYVGETATEIIVAMRGTLPLNLSSPDKRQSILDWLNDGDAIPVAFDAFPGLVHRGFLNALNTMWPGMGPAVNIANAASPLKPIYVTGHSKGGAMANLAALRIKASIPNATVIVTTFAAARPGDAAFQANYDQVVPHSVRFEYQDDIVPHLPPTNEFLNLLRNIPEFAKDLKAVINADFVSVGALYFINWDTPTTFDSESFLLEMERRLSLGKLILTLQFAHIAGDHTIDPGGGYAGAPYV
jgi:hypothetical protein